MSADGLFDSVDEDAERKRKRKGLGALMQMTMLLFACLTSLLFPPPPTLIQ